MRLGFARCARYAPLILNAAAPARAASHPRPPPSPCSSAPASSSSRPCSCGSALLAPHHSTTATILAPPLLHSSACSLSHSQSRSPCSSACALPASVVVLVVLMPPRLPRAAAAQPRPTLPPPRSLRAHIGSIRSRARRRPLRLRLVVRQSYRASWRVRAPVGARRRRRSVPSR